MKKLFIITLAMGLAGPVHATDVDAVYLIEIYKQACDQADCTLEELKPIITMVHGDR